MNGGFRHSHQQTCLHLHCCLRAEIMFDLKFLSSTTYQNPNPYPSPSLHGIELAHHQGMYLLLPVGVAFYLPSSYVWVEVTLRLNANTNI
jgi:hypothetical protein